MVLNKIKKVSRKVPIVLNIICLILRIMEKVLKYMPAAMQKLKQQPINLNYSTGLIHITTLVLFSYFPMSLVAMMAMMSVSGRMPSPPPSVRQ